MTMHLVRGMTTTNTKKLKSKKKTKSLLKAEQEHAKFLKRMGIEDDKRGLAQSGRAGALGASGRWFNSSIPDQSSMPDQCFYDPSMAKKVPIQYTGTEIIGIAQMHKSNAVPIRNKKSAEEVAKMRRG
jgi:hypothetical protein